MERFLGTPDAHLQLNFGRWKKTLTWQDCRMKIRNWMRDCRQMTEIPLHWLSSHQVSYCSVSFDVVFLTGSRTANWTELWSKFLITRFGMRWIYSISDMTKFYVFWTRENLISSVLISSLSSKNHSLQHLSGPFPNESFNENSHMAARGHSNFERLSAQV